jgi:hypothetical protein
MFSYVNLIEAVNEKDSIKFEEAFDYIMKAKVASVIEEIRSNILEKKEEYMDDEEEDDEDKEDDEDEDKEDKEKENND